MANDLVTELDLFITFLRGFNRTFAKGMACQQETLTLPSKHVSSSSFGFANVRLVESSPLPKFVTGLEYTDFEISTSVPLFYLLSSLQTFNIRIN